MRLEKIISEDNLNLFNEIDKLRVPEHIAIIMDGNGRWAKQKSKMRLYGHLNGCLLYTSPSPRDRTRSRMPSSA